MLTFYTVLFARFTSNLKNTATRFGGQVFMVKFIFWFTFSSCSVRNALIQWLVVNAANWQLDAITRPARSLDREAFAIYGVYALLFLASWLGNHQVTLCSETSRVKTSLTSSTVWCRAFAFASASSAIFLSLSICLPTRMSSRSTRTLIFYTLRSVFSRRWALCNNIRSRGIAL